MLPDGGFLINFEGGNSVKEPGGALVRPDTADFERHQLLLVAASGEKHERDYCEEIAVQIASNFARD